MTSDPHAKVKMPINLLADARGLKKFWRYNGLSIVLLGLFLVSAVGQSLTGWFAYNDDQRDHGYAAITYASYLTTGHFWEALGENWESEFLQMAAFVILTACLFQKGSPESKDPDKADEPEPPVTPDSPAPVKHGGWQLWLYERSLSIALLALFLLSMVIHAVGGAHEFNREQAFVGQPAVSVWRFCVSSQFWFQSLQNWQSEFLSIAAMVILAIFLRQKGSAESKATTAANWENE